MRVQNEESVDLEAGEEISNHVVAAGHYNEIDAPGKPKIPASSTTLEASPLLITLKVRHPSIHRVVVVFSSRLRESERLFKCCKSEWDLYMEHWAEGHCLMSEMVSLVDCSDIFCDDRVCVDVHFDFDASNTCGGCAMCVCFVNLLVLGFVCMCVCACF